MKTLILIVVALFAEISLSQAQKIEVPDKFYFDLLGKKNALPALETEIKMLQKSVTNSNEKHEDAIKNPAIQKLIAEKKTLEQDIEHLTEEKNGKKAENAQLNSDIKGLESQIESKKNELLALEKPNEELVTLQDSLKKLEAKISALETNKVDDTLVKEFKKIKMDKKDKERANALLKTQQSTLSNEIKELKPNEEKLNTLNTKQKELKKNVSNQENIKEQQAKQLTKLREIAEQKKQSEKYLNKLIQISNEIK